MSTFPLSEVLLSVNGQPTLIATENNLSVVGSEYNTDTNQIISSIWVSANPSGQIVLLYPDNSYQSFIEIENTANYSGINNTRTIYRTLGSYDTMPDDLKVRAANCPYKDAIIAWYMDGDTLILNLGGTSI